MNNEPARRMRARIKFAKTGVMRFTGHLDLHRSWERTFRRAGLPLAYSQGYNPRPKINLASALPLGFTSDSEILDAWLERRFSLENISVALDAALPPGLVLLQVSEASQSAPALQTELRAAEFVLTFLDHFPKLEPRRLEIVAAESLPRQRMRKGKVNQYDLRPLILALEAMPNDNQGRQCLFTRLSASQEATGRPEEVILALGYPPETARVHRTGLIFQPITA